MKTIVIIGCGGRGLGYTFNIKKYGKGVKVVGLVDPNPERIIKARKIFPEINDSMIFDDWESFVKAGKIADAVVIATQDQMHTKPAIACANLGYHILLEKPMAPTAEECREIVEAVKKNNVIFSVCHVLRYTKFFQMLKEMIEKKVIGDLVTIQHFEHVGYWHMAHSYVRGKWRNTKESSFMLLAKSCHDIDILRYLVGRPCKKVQSFGSLKHFRKENKPTEAGDARYCIKCHHEAQCPYSAVKIYFLDHFNQGNKGWPVSVLVDEVTGENVIQAISTGPYGRCVYECDNDVVDHQVVNLEYEGGITASFTMSGFNIGNREIIIQGSRGMIRGDLVGKKIVITDFLTNETKTIDVTPLVDDFHGGGDDGLMIEWLRALVINDKSLLTTGPDEALESHLTVFLAEESRIKSTVENV